MFRKCYAAVTLTICIWLGGAHGAAASPQQPAAGSTSQAPQTQQQAKAAGAFLQEAEALYEAANGGDGTSIAKQAARTEARLRALPMEGVATAEGIEALAGSVSRMKRLAAAVRPDPEKIRNQAAEIRLAADALVHPQTSMWHRYGPILQEDLRLLEKAIAEKAGQAEQLGRLRGLQAHYQLIRTAILIHTQTYKVERADAILRYAERILGAKQPNPVYTADLVPSLQDAVGGLFPVQEQSSSTEAMVTPVSGPPWGWSAFMGVFIVAVLSWAGWRRYQRLEPIPPRGSLPPERHGRR